MHIAYIVHVVINASRTSERRYRMQMSNAWSLCTLRNVDQCRTMSNVGGWWTERHWRRVSRLVGCQSQLGSCAVFASEWRCDSIIDFDNQYQSVIRTGNSQKRFVRDAVSEWCKLDLFKRLRSTTWRHTRGHNENVENVSTTRTSINEVSVWTSINVIRVRCKDSNTSKCWKRTWY